MSAEELLKMLREAGLNDESIGNLLKDALASMSGDAVRQDDKPSDDEEERAEAEKMLGL